MTITTSETGRVFINDKKLSCGTNTESTTLILHLEVHYAYAPA